MALFVVSCSKDNTNGYTPEQKLYPVKFTTSLNFNGEDSKLTRGGYDSIGYDSTGYDTTSVSVYYRYLVYANNGSLIKHIKGTGTEVYDQLPAGAYHIAFAASDNKEFNTNYYFSPGHYSYDSISYPKTFYKTFTYYVDSINTNDVKAVSLERMWGEINLQINDRQSFYVPSDVQKVTVKVKGISPSFLVQNGNGLFNNSVTSRDFTVSAFRNTPIIDCLTSYATQSDNVEVELVFTYADNSQKNVVLANTSVKKGVKTTLKGSLGDVLKENSQNMSISLEDAWQSEIISF